MRKSTVKRILPIIFCGAAAVFCISCGISGGKTDEKNKNIQVSYSNMTEEDILEDVKAALLASGIEKGRVEAFAGQVHLFNESMPGELLSKGYVDAGANDILYDPYDMQDIWMRKYPDFQGYNCRITAFSLYRDLIEVNPDAEVRNELLFMDEESLDYNDDIVKDEAGKKKFLQIFSSIPATATSDIEEHAKTVSEYNDKNGISFADNDNVSMVSVYFHDDIDPNDQKLFVGHVGIMVKSDDGVYFIEKVAFQEPYRVNKLKDIQEVKKYLLEKYDIEENQTHARPFVMEDGRLVE